MEATTARTPESSTGSRTIADLLPRAADKHADRTAVRYKRAGEWHAVSFEEVGRIVREIGLGLIALGIEPGDRVCILSQTRPEWTYCDFAIPSAGGVVVPIYPTNSPEECEWVAGNSDARAVVCENPAQLGKVAEIRERLPQLRTVIVIESGGDTGDAISLEEVRERGRAVDPAELDRRIEAIGPEDPFTFIYTSGTTGPPKGCVLAHGNYREVLNMCEANSILESGEVTYLYLPLAHSFALLVQLLSFDLGGELAYFGGDTKQIIAELTEIRPTYFPSVPRIFEKLYTLVTANGDPDKIRQAVKVGMKVRRLRQAGEEIGPELQDAFDQADEQLFSKVRAAFGGRVRQAVTGAAPIAPEILEFFYACGVPVLEGYGMTETATVATYSTIEEHKFGTVGRLLPGVEAKIADDGELLLKGANIFQGYYKNADASFGAIEDGWLHTGDLGSIDEDGYLRITGRKKDIIITAGGKNLTPANIENDLKQSRWISQAVMHGDRRPFPVILITLDPEEIVQFAREHGLAEDVAALSRDPKVHDLIQGVVDAVNRKYAQVEQVKRFAILDHDLSQEGGELTPTLKVKRNVVNEKYREVFDSLYR
ncbi:MAG: AMP-dependent synthetase/ligase [Solirubrobacteraceae bacterium]